jgi:hypothetical protein
VPSEVTAASTTGEANPRSLQCAPSDALSSRHIIVLALEAHMPPWMDAATNMFVGALTLMLVVKYRDPRGVLKWIGDPSVSLRG